MGSSSSFRARAVTSALRSPTSNWIQAFKKALPERLATEAACRKYRSQIPSVFERSSSFSSSALSAVSFGNRNGGKTSSSSPLSRERIAKSTCSLSISSASSAWYCVRSSLRRSISTVRTGPFDSTTCSSRSVLLTGGMLPMGSSDGRKLNKYSCRRR